MNSEIQTTKKVRNQASFLAYNAMLAIISCFFNLNSGLAQDTGGQAANREAPGLANAGQEPVNKGAAPKNDNAAPENDNAALRIECTAVNNASAGDTSLGQLACIQQMEEKLFNRAFPTESTNERLERLENFAFGLPGKGSDPKRIDKLKSVLGKNFLDGSAGGTNTSVQDSVSTTANDSSDPGSSGTRKKQPSLLDIINNGIDNYNKHRYHNAEDDFNEALELAPGMSRIHAYLGITLLQMNQRKAAIDALRASYELDPFGSYGRYSKNCLIILMGDEEVRKRGPKDDLKTVQKTISKVNTNADSESSRHNRFGERIASDRQFSGSRAASSMVYDADSWTNQAALRQRYMRSDASEQAARVRQDAARRASLTQESANNLKSLITAKILPGDAKLRAFGTSLTARYYGDETRNLAPWYIPREAPLELKAKPALLVGARSKSASRSLKPVAKRKTTAAKRTVTPVSRFQSSRRVVTKTATSPRAKSINKIKRTGKPNANTKMTAKSAKNKMQTGTKGGASGKKGAKK